MRGRESQTPARQWNQAKKNELFDPHPGQLIFLSLIFTASRVSAILSLPFLLFPALSPFYHGRVVSFSKRTWKCFPTCEKMPLIDMMGCEKSVRHAHLESKVKTQRKGHKNSKLILAKLSGSSSQEQSIWRKQRLWLHTRETGLFLMLAWMPLIPELNPGTWNHFITSFVKISAQNLEKKLGRAGNFLPSCLQVVILSWWSRFGAQVSGRLQAWKAWLSTIHVVWCTS